MIAGMLDPSILGHKGANAHQMSGNSDHEFCHHDGRGDMMKDHQQMKKNMPMNKQGHNH
jgi:hypothetical protein